MSDKQVLQNWIARCHSCGRDSIVPLDRSTGRFAEQACPHCGQANGYDGLRPNDGSMSADMVPPKTAENKPKTGTGKGKSPIANLIGGK